MASFAVGNVFTVLLVGVCTTSIVSDDKISTVHALYS